MTDNRTTELAATERIIATLRERGVQFATYGNTDRVWWTTENGVAWYAQDRPNANDLYVKLEAVLTPEKAIAATLGNDGVERSNDGVAELQVENAKLGSEPPYDELLRCLENDWHIHASWDGLRKFWCIELTEEGVRMRDAKVVG